MRNKYLYILSAAFLLQHQAANAELLFLASLEDGTTTFLYDTQSLQVEIINNEYVVAGIAVRVVPRNPRIQPSNLFPTIRVDDCDVGYGPMVISNVDKDIEPHKTAFLLGGDSVSSKVAAMICHMFDQTYPQDKQKAR